MDDAASAPMAGRQASAGGSGAEDAIGRRVNASGEDILKLFAETRLGKAPQNINCYGCALKEWPEALGKPAVIDDLLPNPWGKTDDTSGLIDWAMGQRADQIELTVKSNLTEINVNDLQRGDIITWKGTFEHNIYGIRDSYEYVSHAGIYYGNGEVFSKMGYKGAYEILPLSLPRLALYGSTSYWRLLMKGATNE